MNHILRIPYRFYEIFLENRQDREEPQRGMCDLKNLLAFHIALSGSKRYGLECIEKTARAAKYRKGKVFGIENLSVP